MVIIGAWTQHDTLTLYILHTNTLQTTHCTHCVLHTNTLHSTYCKLHTAHCTLHITHRTVQHTKLSGTRTGTLINLPTLASNLTNHPKPLLLLTSTCRLSVAALSSDSPASLSSRATCASRAVHRASFSARVAARWFAIA